MRQENAQIKLCDTAEPFSDNLEYLSAIESEANIRLAIAYMRANSNEGTGSPGDSVPDFSFLNPGLGKMSVRNLEELLDQVQKENRSRARAAAELGMELKFEKIVETYRLDSFERAALLVLFANNACMSFRNLFRECRIGPWHSDGRMNVETVLRIASSDKREQIVQRKSFSVGGRLVREEMFLVFEGIENTTNILDVDVFLHERIVRFILGNDDTYYLASQFITREESTIRMDQVVLPDSQREEIERLVDNYAGGAVGRKKLKLDEFYGYGTGLTLLFYGPSGTGKTMLARAIANRLDRTIFCLNAGENFSGRNGGITFQDRIKYIFKEARLSNGIVFFDECDDLFKNDSMESMSLLIEMEKARCITILATNKVNELDPTLERRISKKVHFQFPDDFQRERIWRKMIPENVTLAGDVDIATLARNYVFTGGLIRNTIQMAISGALAKDGDGNVVVSGKEIEIAAEDQARRAFGAFESYYTIHVPTKNIEDLLLPPDERQKLQGIVSAYRAGIEDMHVVVGARDLSGGMEAIKAVAKEGGLVVREFNLIQAVILEFRAPVLKDPLSQEDIRRLSDFVFMAGTGRRSITVLVDDQSFFEKRFDEHKKGGNELYGISLWFDYFLRKLKAFRGPVFLLTVPFRNRMVPDGFDSYLELRQAPGEARLRRWRELIGTEHSGDETAWFAETFPIDLEHIGLAVKRARILSHLKGKGGCLDEEMIREAVDSLKISMNGPLFGNAQN